MKTLFRALFALLLAVAPLAAMAQPVGGPPGPGPVPFSYPLLAPDGAVGGPSYSFLAEPSTGFYRAGTADLRVALGGIDVMHFATTTTTLRNGTSLSWGSSGVTSPDLLMFRDGAGFSSQRNGTSPQISCVFNTWTDSSNYEAVCLDWQTTTNFATIGLKSAGTGVARELDIKGAATNQLLAFGNNGSVVLGAASGQTLALRAGGSTFAQNVSGTSNFQINAGLMFGAPTISTPSLVASGAGLRAQLGNASGPTQFSGSALRTETAYTVVTLPTCNAGAAGLRAYVTDATAPTFLGTLTGGGAVVTPVFCNATAWVAG